MKKKAVKSEKRSAYIQTLVYFPKGWKWLSDAVKDIAAETGRSEADLFRIAFCEHWSKTFPKLAERYKAWKHVQD